MIKMLLIRRGTFYNPFFIGEFELKDIVFYNEGGVVLRTNRGWLSQGNNDMEQYHVEGELIVKRRVNCTINKPYLLHIKREYPTERGKFAHLYLPFKPEDWEVKEVITKGFLRDSVVEEYRHKDGFIISKFIKDILNKDNIEFYDNVKELVGLVGCKRIDSILIADNKDRIIQKAEQISNKFR